MDGWVGGWVGGLVGGWMDGWMDGWIALGFRTSRSQSTYALINGPFVPHINLWEPCYFTEVPDGPQTYTLNVLWLQEEGALIRMS